MPTEHCQSFLPCSVAGFFGPVPRSSPKPPEHTKEPVNSFVPSVFLSDDQLPLSTTSTIRISELCALFLPLFFSHHNHINDNHDHDDNSPFSLFLFQPTQPTTSTSASCRTPTRFPFLFSPSPPTHDHIQNDCSTMYVAPSALLKLPHGFARYLGHCPFLFTLLNSC